MVDLKNVTSPTFRWSARCILIMVEKEKKCDKYDFTVVGYVTTVPMVAYVLYK